VTTRPMPLHWPRLTLIWLDGLVGGRAELLALRDVDPPPVFHALGDAADGLAYDALAEEVDHAAEHIGDDEVADALDRAMATFWFLKPARIRVGGADRARSLAGGLVWVVGKANGVFDARRRQVDLQRVMGLDRPLAAPGVAVARVVGRRRPVASPRPYDAPDLVGFGRPSLLTPTTRRIVLEWRDRALDASEPCW
jgi:hypothetical protein